MAPFSSLPCWALATNARLGASQVCGRNRADRPMQHRFLRRPGQRQSCKGPKRRGIRKMKRQLFILNCLSSAQPRTASARNPRRLVSSSPWRYKSPATDFPADAADPATATRIQFATDLEYNGLDRAFPTHCRLRRYGVSFGFNSVYAQPYPKPPRLACTKSRLFQRLHKLMFMEAH
jgi:hypothetical protein